MVFRSTGVLRLHFIPHPVRCAGFFVFRSTMLGFTAPPRFVTVDNAIPIVPPSNITPPVLSGSFFVGQALSSSAGTWSGSPTAYEYKWQKDSVDTGDTAATRNVISTDNAGLLKCLVRAQNAAGWSSWVESNAVYGIQLALWLDASDTSTITQTAGSVSAWNDKSGNALHVSQSTGSRQPVTGTRSINSLNVLDFDGVDDALNKSTATDFGGGDYTIFTVTSSDTAASGKRIITKGNHWGLSVGESGSPSLADASYGNTSSASNSRGATTVTGSGRIMGARRSSTSQYLFTGATDYTAASANNVTGGQLAIGSYNNSSAYFDGMIGEILIGQRAWSNAERNQVASYLTSKWGISWTTR